MINQSAESPSHGFDKFNQNMADGDDIDFYNNLKRAVDDENLDADDMALEMRNQGMKQDFDDDDQYEDDFINDNSQGDDMFVQNMGSGMIDK